MLAHHKTVEAAKLARDREQISADNYRAVITRRLTLAEAKKLGPEGSRMLPEVEGFKDLVEMMQDLGTRQVRKAYERAFGGGK